jgi:hypothetical protein
MRTIPDPNDPAVVKWPDRSQPAWTALFDRFPSFDIELPTRHAPHH